MNVVYSEYTLDNGRRVTFCTNAHSHDPYSKRVRKSWHLDATVLLARQLVDHTNAFVDLGANIGCFSVPLTLLTGATGVAVEALPENVRLLNECIKVNQVVNISAVQSAVSDVRSVVYFKGEGAYGTMSNDQQGVAVASRSLSDIVSDARVAASLIKIDVEGSEMKVLTGSPEVFESDTCRDVIIEANGPHCLRKGYMPQYLLKFLEDRGFHIYLIAGVTLVSRTSDDFQEFGNCDYLATKGPMQGGLPGHKFRALSRERSVQEVIRCLVGLKPQYRAFMIEQINEMEPQIAEDSRIIDAMKQQP